MNVTKGTAPSLSVTYNASTNRRTTDSADANGNILQSGVTTYDVENRITQANNGDVKYSYAPGNKRIWRGVWTSGTQTTDEITFYSTSGAKLAAYNLTGNNYGPLFATSTGYYEYFGGKLLKNSGGYVNSDRLGSVGKYFPYGQERPSDTSNGKEKFATYIRDAETGLDYAQARYHSSGEGCFLSPDPYQGSAGPSDPGSWNRYAYSGSDPINNHDPSGLFYSSASTGGCFLDGISIGCADLDQIYCSLHDFSFYPGFNTCMDFVPEPEPGPEPPIIEEEKKPECFAQLKYNGVASGDVHAFWYVQNSAGEQWVVRAGPEHEPVGLNPITADYGYLVVDKRRTNRLAGFADQLTDGVAWRSGLSSDHCAGVDALLSAADSWNNEQVSYHPLGPNSNTFASYLGSIGGFNASPPDGAVGWDASFDRSTIDGRTVKKRR